MPRRFTRLFGLLCGVGAALLFAVSYGHAMWVVFGAAVVVGVILGVRVTNAKVVLESDAIRVQGVLRSSLFHADRIRDIEVADSTPATVQARLGPIPRIQTCRLVLSDGRRVPLSTARVSMRTAQNNLLDTELTQLRDVLEAWLTQAPGHRTG